MNEILCKDNLEVLKQMQDKSIDLILEDMPYNTTDLHFEYRVDLESYWAERLRVIKDNGAIVLTACQPFTTDLIISNRKLFRYEIIWKKTQVSGYLDAKRKPLKTHENILVFYKKQPTYNPQKTLANTPTLRKATNLERKPSHYGKYTHRKESGTNDNTRYPTSVLQVSNWNGALFGNTKKAVIHPTQKPVDLFRWLIRTYTNEGDLVFDGYAGSGTTGVASIFENRNFICCEWDDEYFQKAKKRIEDAKLQKDFTLDL